MSPDARPQAGRLKTAEVIPGVSGCVKVSPLGSTRGRCRRRSSVDRSAAPEEGRGARAAANDRSRSRVRRSLSPGSYRAADLLTGRLRCPAPSACRCLGREPRARPPPTVRSGWRKRAARTGRHRRSNQNHRMALPPRPSLVGGRFGCPLRIRARGRFRCPLHSRARTARTNSMAKNRPRVPERSASRDAPRSGTLALSEMWKGPGSRTRCRSSRPGTRVSIQLSMSHGCRSLT
jgi:hypothetical protein